jgi:hypothetical protein
MIVTENDKQIMKISNKTEGISQISIKLLLTDHSYFSEKNYPMLLAIAFTHQITQYTSELR